MVYALLYAGAVAGGRTSPLAALLVLSLLFLVFTAIYYYGNRSASTERNR